VPVGHLQHGFCPYLFVEFFAGDRHGQLLRIYTAWSLGVMVDESNIVFGLGI